MNNRAGILTVISGFSGAGKGTLVKALCEKYDNYALSISATTREPRNGEEEGVAYFFKSVEEFEEMIEKGAFVEHAKYVENHYGTPKDYVEHQLNEGKDVILEIEIQGALKVKERFPDTLLMFVTTPDADTLKKRLIGRGTESETVIASRLARAVEEAEEISKYDYVIVNDDIEETVDKVHDIIRSEHDRATRNGDFIEELKNDMKKFSKGE